MPFRKGDYLIRIAAHAEPRFNILLGEFEQLGQGDKFLAALNRLAADISQSQDPEDWELAPGRSDIWVSTVAGALMMFSVDEGAKWIVVEQIP